ncbi:SDR family oxidoreductase [Acidihalobacter yilgarnensis]|uniref:SDR family oxidoreductase n=1 Tax=Acidihalobacter yilgarnensis TaxID=2819280 RepID=UPI0018D2BC3D|nr:SDR family oxidoreductase [Acidihalobacter yilgarnensis]
MLAPYLINTGLVELLHAGADANDSPTDIVHITDIFALSPKPEFDLYCATKAGLENLSQSFAKRYAPRIKVNCLQPGPILFKDSHTPEMRRRVLAETPLGREGGPEAVYRALRALLDNDYLTGTSIPVDGGRHLAR